MGLNAIIRLSDVTAQDVATLNKRLHEMLQQTNNGGEFEYENDGTAELFTYWRYYGPGYERGPWLYIAAVLRTAIAVLPNALVYYASDTEWYYESTPPMTIDRLEQFWRWFEGPHGDDYRKRMEQSTSRNANR